MSTLSSKFAPSYFNFSDLGYKAGDSIYVNNNSYNIVSISGHEATLDSHGSFQNPSIFTKVLVQPSSSYIDFLSISGQTDVIVNSIHLRNDNISIKGFECSTSAFTVANNLPNVVIEKCISNFDGSFRTHIQPPYTYNANTITSGTFIDCLANGVSFGNGEKCVGTFIRCTGGQYSFGGGGSADGVFIDCVGDTASFGGTNTGLSNYTCTATGYFLRCKSIGSKSFGVTAGSSIGTFVGSIGSKSFGVAAGYSIGTFIECIGSGVFSFMGSQNSASICRGNFYRCQGGLYSFGGNYNGLAGTFDGKATQCISGQGSFGSTVITGKLINCIMEVQDDPIDGTNVTFPNCTGTGKIVNCIDATYAVITK